MERETSQTDKKYYRQACEEAVSSEEVFSTFKRHPPFFRVVENVIPQIGKFYFERIKTTCPSLLNLMDTYKENDKLGYPRTHDYGFGEISATTLRYISFLADINILFGSLNGFDVVEIGGGYGGQCKILTDTYHCSSYTLIDLTPALELQQKYLSRLGLDQTNVTYLTMRQVEERGDHDYDLCISNYAFSECRKDIQALYISKIINHSRRGYMNMNFIFPFSYKKEELPLVMPGADIRLTTPNNLLVTWGTSEQLRDSLCP